MRSKRQSLCSMCQELPATTTWGLPVCQPCADWLAWLDDELKQLEKCEYDDPTS